MTRLQYYCSWLLILACCLALPSQAQDSTSPTEAAALHSLAREFFAAYARKDMEGWLRTWSRKAQGLEARAQQTQKLFAELGAVELKELSVSQTAIQGEKASLRVTVEIRAVDKSGQPAAGFGKWQRALQCVKEGGEWKVWRETSVAREIAEALAAAPGEPARAARLAAEKESVTPELAQELFNQGGQLYRRENFTQAIAIFQLARKIAEQFNDQMGAARCLSNIGMAQHAQGDYVSAVASYQQSLKMAQELGVKLGILANLNNLGNVYAELGNYDAALAAYRQILGLAEAEGDQANVVIVLNNLANVYASTGNNAKSLEHLHRALALTESGGSRLSRAISLSTLAWIFFRQGNDELAEDYFQQSLGMLQRAETDPTTKTATADTLSNLGKVAKKRGRYDEALTYYQQSLKLREGRSEVEAAHELMNIGDVYRLQGRDREALECYERSLAVAEKWNDQKGVASTLTSLGLLYERQGRHQQVAEAAERSAAIAGRVGNRELFWQARSLAGRSYDALGQTIQARQAFDEAISAIEDLWTQAAGGERQQQWFFEDKLAPYHSALRLRLRQQQPWEALGYAERARARTLLEVLQSGRVNVTKAMTAAEQEQERQLTDEMISLNAQVYRENLRARPDSARLTELGKFLRRARIEYEAFQTKLYAAHPDLKIKRGQALPFTSVQAAEVLADADTAVLEYVVAEDKTFLFVLTSAAAAITARAKPTLARQVSAAAEAFPTSPVLKVYELPIRRETLNERARGFRELLAKHDLVFRPASATLYDLLLKPAEALLEGKKRLVIVPDASLWELPFQALQTSDQHFLIEDYEVSYAPSLAVLVETIRARGKRANEAGAATLLAFGNPALGQPSDIRPGSRQGAEMFRPLPETETEVKALAQLYGSQTSKVYVGAAAREEQFKSEAGRFRILHLATHGILDDASPMYSQLVLSQSGKSAAEDGLLEAWEIMQLDLRADLVVLSACETARGRVGGGEGALGLAWALFVAGSPATVASQWKVDSASTSELMLEFHRHLKASRERAGPRLTTAGALREAARKLLRNTPHRHPFYWAGFVLIGDGY